MWPRIGKTSFPSEVFDNLCRKLESCHKYGA